MEHIKDTKNGRRRIHTRYEHLRSLILTSTIVDDRVENGRPHDLGAERSFTGARTSADQYGRCGVAIGGAGSGA